MRILALETATEACSAALYCDGEVQERFELAPRRHAELILPMVRALLAEAGMTLGELDALAFGRGPGAFTSLRIAAGVAQGLALGADLAVVPISTLAALAFEVFAESQAEYALVALDARMGEVYWGVYRRDRDESLIAEIVAAPEAVPVDFPGSASAIGIGSGWEVHGDVLRRRVGEDRLLEIWSQRLPRASAVVKLAAGMLTKGQAVAPEQALPVYLRDRVALTRTQSTAGG